MANAVLAQPTIKEVLQRLPGRTLPYAGEKRDLRSEGASGVYHADNKIIDRLYTNIQLTEWRNASEYPAETPESCHRFIVPGTTDCLLTITLGGITDYRTNMLLYVTENGDILDQMPVAVMLVGIHEYIPVMQYRITGDAKIIVSRLEPVSSQSIDLLDFTSFVANRVDRTYEIDAQGKFHLLETKKYVSRTYTKKMLEAPGYNVYSGTESPM